MDGDVLSVVIVVDDVSGWGLVVVCCECLDAAVVRNTLEVPLNVPAQQAQMLLGENLYGWRNGAGYGGTEEITVEAHPGN